MKRLALALALTLLLSACAGLVPDNRERDAVAALLAYNQRLAALSGDEQRREFLAAQQAFADEASEANRLRLALALCLPNAAWRDDGRLLRLLEASPALKAAETSPLRHLTLLLQQEVSERLQAERRLEAQLRDERRQSREEKRNAEELRRSAEEQRRKAEELQRKLEDVLAIDRELARRPRR